MKLFKEKVKGKGYMITVKIGKRENSSYWTSPPIYCIDNHSFNFEKEYLIGRYPLINTKKKAKQFSSLYKNLWIEVTDHQRTLMEHCIGVGKRAKPYRNYYMTNHDDKDWDYLIKKGLAEKSKEEPNSYGCIYFWLTKQGVEFILNKSVSYKVYEEL